jgi:hypothetical protein
MEGVAKPLELILTVLFSGLSPVLLILDTPLATPLDDVFADDELLFDSSTLLFVDNISLDIRSYFCI